MIIALEVGTSFNLSRYVVRIMLRRDNPAFPRYCVFRAGKFIGSLFSRPCLTDCERLERGVVNGATKVHLTEPEHSLTEHRRRGGLATRKGRESRLWKNGGRGDRTD